MDTIHVDRIIRSRRRTVALVVTEDAKLIVRAPMDTPVSSIEDLVDQKRTWITRMIGEMKKRPAPPERTFATGGEFLFLGKTYRMQIVDGDAADIELADRLYIADRVLPGIRERLGQWYRVQAGEIITRRCAWYTTSTGYRPVSIRMTDARRRWGSCSSKGTLNFSWRIIMAPMDIVDYVVVHELVHLDQPDHSRHFWKKVENVMPDYAVRRDWLKEHAYLLTL